MPHAQHACLVLDFYELDCNWFQKMTSWKSFCRVVFADVTFRAEEATTGNTSTSAGLTCDQAYFSLDMVRKGTPDTIS